jgi:hypothetical protein
MTIALKLARRCFHSLRQLGPAALEPVTSAIFTVPPAIAFAKPTSPR